MQLILYISCLRLVQITYICIADLIFAFQLQLLTDYIIIYLDAHHRQH